MKSRCSYHTFIALKYGDNFLVDKDCEYECGGKKFSHYKK